MNYRATFASCVFSAVTILISIVCFGAAPRPVRGVEEASSVELLSAKSARVLAKRIAELCSHGKSSDEAVSAVLKKNTPVELCKLVREIYLHEFAWQGRRITRTVPMPKIIWPGGGISNEQRAAWAGRGARQYSCESMSADGRTVIINVRQEFPQAHSFFNNAFFGDAFLVVNGKEGSVEKVYIMPTLTKFMAPHYCLSADERYLIIGSAV